MRGRVSATLAIGNLSSHQRADSLSSRQRADSHAAACAAVLPCCRADSRLKPRGWIPQRASLGWEQGDQNGDLHLARERSLLAIALAFPGRMRIHRMCWFVGVVPRFLFIEE
jgi:hypothetical protein